MVKGGREEVIKDFKKIRRLGLGQKIKKEVIG